MHGGEHQHKHKQRGLESRNPIELQFHTWKPFLQQLVDSSNPPDPNPRHSFKRPCLSDRTTPPTLDSHLSRLSLFDDSRSVSWKRRRRGSSRSLSGRSTDRSRRRGCSVGGGTCSDLPVATGGTDSSGELFLNGGDGNWGSDVSEASRGNNRREKEERESLSFASGVVQIGSFENQGNESGYGSEPGYRGDAEIGYGDEVDTEEDEHRISVWGNKFQGRDTNMKIAGENTLQKAHHRCRRKKHDVRMVDALG